MCECHRLGARADALQAALLPEASCSVQRSLPSGGYSTVTDFARLRGWSTSVPLSTAVW